MRSDTRTENHKVLSFYIYIYIHIYSLADTEENDNGLYIDWFQSLLELAESLFMLVKGITIIVISVIG